jgi:hypothetical protein
MSQPTLLIGQWRGPIFLLVARLWRYSVAWRDSDASPFSFAQDKRKNFLPQFISSPSPRSPLHTTQQLLRLPICFPVADIRHCSRSWNFGPRKQTVCCGDGRCELSPAALVHWRPLYLMVICTHYPCDSVYSPFAPPPRASSFFFAYDPKTSARREKTNCTRDMASISCFLPRSVSIDGRCIRKSYCFISWGAYPQTLHP